jgi:para-aminobenzoate synthetase component I
MRKWFTYSFGNNQLQERLTALAAETDTACVCGGNGKQGFSEELIAGFGIHSVITSNEQSDSFSALQSYVNSTRDWIFGHFSYDLKNEIEKGISSAHHDGIGFPLLHFFCPKQIVRKKNNSEIEIGCFEGESEAIELFQRLLSIEIQESLTALPVSILERTSRDAYIKAVEQLKKHIARGDIYETNYCIEFYAMQAQINTAALQQKLNALSAAPFAVFYKLQHLHLCCASPERFIQKTGNTLRSQPIKGTRRRGASEAEDELLRAELLNDDKERCENVMIVDLVRNDLSRSAARGSVHVPELFGIHTFKTVHQMISTVEARLAEDVHPVEAIRRAFPMGSMTGAPKLRAMQLCEATEHMRRGLYSGAAGYFTPDMDFDFNVVIRSIQYNAQTGYLSLMAGSAITAAAQAEAEYEECKLKATALLRALGAENSA